MLDEPASMLRYTHTACLNCISIQIWNGPTIRQTNPVQGLGADPLSQTDRQNLERQLCEERLKYLYRAMVGWLAG